MRNLPRVLAIVAALATSTLLYLGTTAPAFADLGTSDDGPCTTSDFTGNSYTGEWTREFKPHCSGNTVGWVDITWRNYLDGVNQRHILWNAVVQAGAISGDSCIEVALDWLNVTGGHSDTQIMRNCKENSTRRMSNQDIVLQDPGNEAPWPVHQLQIGTYDPDNGSVVSKVCPSDPNAPADTRTDPDCSNWYSKGDGPVWGSTAAKIYRRTNAGVDEQNDPPYPSVYNYFYQINRDK